MAIFINISDKMNRHFNLFNNWHIYKTIKVHDQKQNSYCASCALYFALMYKYYETHKIKIKINKHKIQRLHKEIVNNTNYEEQTNLYIGINLLCNRHNIKYIELQPELITLKIALCTMNVIIFGLRITSDMANENSYMNMKGVYDIDKSQNNIFVGYHAFVICGYDDMKQSFLCRNSIGENIGVNGMGERIGTKGYVWIKYSYVCNKSYHTNFYVIC